jgi:hypothetical protein
MQKVTTSVATCANTKASEDCFKIIEWGKFLHILNRRFTNFAMICKEIWVCYSI